MQDINTCTITKQYMSFSKMTEGIHARKHYFLYQITRFMPYQYRYQNLYHHKVVRAIQQNDRRYTCQISTLLIPDHKVQYMAYAKVSYTKLQKACATYQHSCTKFQGAVFSLNIPMIYLRNAHGSFSKLHKVYVSFTFNQQDKVFENVCPFLCIQSVIINYAWREFSSLICGRLSKDCVGQFCS